MTAFTFPALALLALAHGDPLLIENAKKASQPLILSAMLDHLGAGLALQGNTLVLGAMDDPSLGDSAGAAYCFELTNGTWTFQDELFGSNVKPNDWFGSAVALDGDTLAIAAENDSEPGSGGGSVYVFVRQAGAWVEQAHIKPGDWEPFDRFGASLALEGDRLAVGSTEPNWPGFWYEGPGVVYVFERNGSTWTQTARLHAENGNDYDHLGNSLALQGDTIVAAAPGDDAGVLNSGAVYVFTFDGSAWSQVAKLKPGDPSALQRFGTDVALQGTTLVIGAEEAMAALSYSGSAYVFEGAGASWTQVQKLVPADLAANDHFGESVAIDGDRLVVGANEADAAGTDSGATYLFRRFGGAWHEMAKLVPEGNQVEDELGKQVALEGQRIVTASPFAAPEFWLPDAGAAYVFELAESADFYCPASTNSSGKPARMGLAGSLSLAANELTLELDAGPAGQLGMFVYGPNVGQIPLSNGWLCVAPGSVGIVRLPPAFHIDPSGHAARTLDFTQPPLGSGLGQVLAGTTWSFQGWFRDSPAGPGASNLTDAARITFQP
jgi:FG-GAP repeat